jgi:hypothetical protein
MKMEPIKTPRRQLTNTKRFTYGVFQKSILMLGSAYERWRSVEKAVHSSVS